MESNICTTLCQRPYHVEHTSSRPITEVKQHWARIVLGWETAWELLVLLAFFSLYFLEIRKSDFLSRANFLAIFML